MTDFRDLGLRDELLRVLEDEDLERPTLLQRAVIPVLRRGGNLVARASSGSGKTLAYTLGVLDRLESPAAEAATEEPVRVRLLVIRPTLDAAERTALTLVPPAQAVGLAVAVPGGPWGTPREVAEIVVTTPETVLDEVRASTLKLDDVEAVVIDGASAVEELGGLEPLETLLDHLPRDAQRVLFSTALSPALEDMVDRRVKRALRFPPEAAVPGGAPSEAGGAVGYIVVPEAQKLDLLARALAERDAGGSPPLLFCRTDERAALVAEALTLRGFALGELGDEEADAVIASAATSRAELEEESGEEAGQTISFDVPEDEEILAARHRGDGNAIVLARAEELAHLREIARRASLAARATSLPLPTAAVREVEQFRDSLRRAVREQDVGAQMLVLAPLFEEFSAAEVAAAATALLRRRAPDAQPVASAPAKSGAGAAARPSTPSPAGAPPATWARLFVGIGSRDAVRPGDLVGAIAGEAEIPGNSVGKIDIRDSFSIVEVQADVAEKVIQALNGTTMKGRSIRVDYDRGGDRPKGGDRGDRGGRAPRSGPHGGGRPGGGGGRGDAPKRTLVRRPRPSE
jgi:ATP-dependent RNA helicase DeaD